MTSRFRWDLAAVVPAVGLTFAAGGGSGSSNGEAGTTQVRRCATAAR